MDKRLGSCLASLRDAADAVRGGDYIDLAPYVADFSDICKDLISDEDISFAIAIVFDQDAGLFSIVETLLPVRDKAVVKARESCWSFLASFVRKIGQRALPYAALLKEKCLNFFRREDAKAVQAASLTPLIVFLESNMAQLKPVSFAVDWGLASLLMNEFHKAKKTNGTLKAHILQLLGYLVEYFKETFDEGNVTSILKLCLNTLEEQLQQPLLVLMAGAMKCLDSVLTWFDDSVPAGGSVESSRRAYTCIEQVLWPREDLKRYQGLRACLQLLSRHACLFSMRLLEDGLRNLHWLQNYCTHQNAEIRDAALPAYDQFMTQISISLVSDNRIKNAQHVYKGFVRDALGVLDAQGADPKRITLAIRAVGKLAAPIVKFSGKDSLKEAFHRLEAFGAPSRAGEGRDESLGYAVTLVGAFADMVIYLDDIEDFMVSFIAQVTGNIFYEFPQLYPKQKQAVYTTLRSLLKSLYGKGTIFSLFLNNIVWSSLERAMDPVDEPLEDGATQLWRHYVELWSHLLDFPSGRGLQAAAGSDEGEAPEEVVASDVGDLGINMTRLRESMFDAIMHCVIKAMTELNLKYRVKPASASTNPEEGEGSPIEPEAEMENIEPLDSLQMRKYLKLVEFVQELLSGAYAYLFQKWTYPFGRCVIELSSKYPLISGFYKLLAVTITTADREGFFSVPKETTESLQGTGRISTHASTSEVQGGAISEEDRRLSIELFSKYLQEVLVASRRYTLELLAACLRLCLSAPPDLVGIASIVPAMKNALKIGLRYFPLAAVAIDAMERWQTAFPEEFQHSLPEIVPCLNDYLVDIESVQLSESETPTDPASASTSTSSTANVSRAELARIKQARAKESQPGPFEVIQVRVQKFLGRIGGFAHLLVSDVDLLQVAGTGGLAWDPVDRVKFTLPFREEKPDIWLDSLLPRMVELALSSSDRRMKVTASELLHAVCLLMLGSAAKGPIRRRGEESQSAHYDKLYKRLFPAILCLATDVELVTRQLFTEFVKQLIHWLTSNQQKENPETMALLDAILDGLVNPENASLREFSADCFAEFMWWSVRHAPPQADNFVNVTSMLRRVYNRMDHPNPYHRLGAAMAAHRMYPVLRENGAVVDRHIFELLFFCIKSLRLGELDDEQIGTMKQMNKTVDLLQKLVLRNMTSLQKKRKDRPLFLAFEDFLFWLFDQTGCLQEKCRTKCMKLFSSICQSIPGVSSASWFHAKIGSGGKLSGSLSKFDVGIESPVSNHLSLQNLQLWLKHCMRSLHWFQWALQEKFFSISEMLEVEKSQTLNVVSSISSFVQNLLESQISTSQFGHLTPGEQENLQTLRCKAVTYLLNLYNQLLSAQVGIPDTEDSSLYSIFNPVHDTSFQKLLCLLLLRPQYLGFVLSEPQRAQDLAKLVMKVLRRLTEVSSTLKIELIKSLKIVISCDGPAYDLCSLNLSLRTSASPKGPGLEDAMSLVKGYQQLNQAGLLQMVLGKSQAAETGERLLITVFSIEQYFPPAVEPIASEMLNLAMVLGVKVGRLLDLVLNERPISITNNQKLTAGEVFYMNFRRTIVQQVKFFYKDCLKHLLEAAVRNQTARMLLMAILDDYSNPSGMGDSITKGSFLQEFLRHVTLLAPCSKPGVSLTMKQFFLEILHKLLMLDTKKDMVLSATNPSCNFIIETFFMFLDCSPEEGTNSTFGKSAAIALKSATLSLVPFFVSPNVDSRRIVQSLTRIVTDHLLVRENDLPRGSIQRATYSQILTCVLGAISSSKSLELLEVFFPLLQSPTKLSMKVVSEAIEVFAGTIDGDMREVAFNLCLKIIKDSSKTTKLRRAIVENVLEPFVNSVPPEFVATWYAQHICNFFQVLKQSPSMVDTERENEDLTSKICHYGLVELLFLRVGAPLLKESISPLLKNADILQLASKECRGKSDPSYKLYPENLPLWRELHCAAYNCLAAVIICTQEQENFFNIFLFKESAKNGTLWDHLVDLNKVYDDFPVETSQLSFASQTLRGMRAARKSRQGRTGSTLSQVTGTLSSQYIISSSFSQEPALISSFVGGQGKAPVVSASLGAGLLLDEEESPHAANVDSPIQGSEEEVVDMIANDQDDFDQHPCMNMVLRIIGHLHSKFGEASRRSPEMPDWMKCLHATLESAGTPINVRLFLAKIVTKACKIFAPYATKWFRPYVQSILLDPQKSGGLSFHYMLRDICISILQWNMPTAPDESLATRLLQHLIGVAAHGSNQVLRANIDIIRLFLEKWKKGIRLERGPLLHYLIAGGKNPDMNDKSIKMQRSVGLQLLGAVVASGFQLYDPLNDESTSEEHMCEALLNNLNVKTKEVYEAAAELLGIAIKQRRDTSGQINQELLETRLHRTLKQLYRDAEYERFLNILNKVTMRDSKFLKGYGVMVVDQLPRLHGVYKSNALDTLLRAPSVEPDLFNQISRSLAKLLTHRDEIAQLKMLQLLAELLKDVSEEKIDERVLPVLCSTFSGHENGDCRQEYYEILIYLYKSKGMNKHCLLIRSLLLGLCDTSDVVRERLQIFWHSQLSQDVSRRFAELINQIYDPALEEYWAQISNVLLLKLCEDSVDYSRPIFTAPLSECEFHDYTINTSWMGGSLPMTPLFSSSQINTSSQATQGDDGEGESSSTQYGPKMIRATMTPSFSLASTQTPRGTISSTQGVSGSTLFAMSQRPGGSGFSHVAGQEGDPMVDPTTNLRRRILNPRAAQSQVMSAVLRANRRREARSAVQALERANKVHMMRQYRTGELPDIEIKHAEILGPLSALAERDPTFARLLLTILCSAVYSLPSAGPDIKAEVRLGLESALQQTHNGISFVGCVEALCLQDPELWISPNLVGSASRKSTNYHSGILLLEKEILHETFPATEMDSNSKRHKGRGGQISRESRPLEDAWLELAQLYKSLGEQDIVLALFQTHVAKNEKTHRALESQLEGNLQRAVNLYDEALHMYEDGSLAGEIPAPEIDIWYNQRYNCLADLNNWEIILKEIVFEITDDDADEPDYKLLWEPKMQERYLRLFINGALKVPRYHTPLTEFIQSSLDDLPKRQFLLNEFSTHLATLAAINGQWDRTRFHLGKCYKVFRKKWSVLHPLALGARHLHIQLLQKTVELDEFVNFISNLHLKELPSFLGGWQKRWPSPDFDDVEAWVDIAQNRLMFFNQIQDQFNQQFQNLRDGEAGTSLVSQLNTERAHLYFQVANGLMKRGAFSVSQSYMNDYHSSQIGFSKKDKLDFEFLKALVKLRCLQSEQIESVSTRVKMLRQLLEYLQGERIKTRNYPEFLQEFHMVEGDVFVKVAWATLEDVPEVSARPHNVDDCFTLLGSAFKAYSTALAHEGSSDNRTATAGNISCREAAKASLKFGLFCDELLKLPNNTRWGNVVGDRIVLGQPYAGLPPASEISRLIIHHMLKALALDSTLQTQHAVARIISLVGQSPETQSEFESLVDGVSSWVFVTWIPQMLANMEEDAGSVLVRVLETIAKLYPQALYFPFHVSESDFGAIGRQRTERLKALLRNPLLEGLIRALEDLTYPEQRLRDGLSQIMNLLFSGDRDRAQSIYCEVYQDCLDTQVLKDPNRQAGEWNLKFARDWAPRIVKELGENGSKLQSMDMKRFSSAVTGIAEQLGRSSTPVGKTSLATLSKWLADFDQSKGFEGEDNVMESDGKWIEIPGQYNCFNVPNMLSHVQLVGFDQTLVCLKSKQRPKILTMRGSNEKDYKFVVKGGEDLRLDQRIEQLFEVMNSVLSQDGPCSQRKLAVPTYSVIPVSKNCGLLQFVENTCVLEDVIKDGLSSKISNLVQLGQKPQQTTPDAMMNNVRLQYMEWVQRKGVAKNLSECYCNLYRKVGYEEVSQKLSALQAQLPWDALRTGFSRLATSAESYLALRSHFSRSLSVMSICGYVAGVGDRHLANTLVDMRSGSLVPIDFGYSFGTNVLLLPVPELVPFRLTAQLTNFLLPLDAISLLRGDMVRIMTALHGSRDVISAVMEVFVTEPLVDWKQEALKLRRARGGAQTTAVEEIGASDLEAASPEQQHVEVKVENAQHKLDLWNPAEITISELQLSIHANKPYTAKLGEIVRGDPTRNARARVAGKVCATVQEQVDCLLDQATDPNLLGRIFAGWQPWV